MNSTVKTVMFWVFILMCLMLLWTVVQKSTGMSKEAEVGYSELLDKIEAGQVQDVAIRHLVRFAFREELQIVWQ